jgi:PAS domain S-box-containing protein
LLDKDYKFLSINKTAADILGMSPQEMIDKSLFEIFPENTAAQFSRNIKNVIDTGQSLLIEEKVVVQDREFDNSTSLSPIKDDKGGVIAVTGIVRDVTDRKQLEEEHQRAAKLESVGTLAGGGALLPIRRQDSLHVSFTHP